MKRTDLERKERELRKQQKKITKLEEIRQTSSEEFSQSGAINRLYSLFQYDKEEIYNINASDELLEFVMMLNEEVDSKQMDNVFRKAIKKTKISHKQEAFNQLKKLLG